MMMLLLAALALLLLITAAMLCIVFSPTPLAPRRSGSGVPIDGRRSAPAPPLARLTPGKIRGAAR